MSDHGNMKNLHGYVKILVDGGNQGQIIYLNRRNLYFEKATTKVIEHGVKGHPILVNI